MKRTRVTASPASNNADVSATGPRASQVVPPSVEYCQRPLLLSTAVTAMPTGSPSASVTWPATRAETSVPLLVTSSSLMVVKALAPDRTGASFTTQRWAKMPSASPGPLPLQRKTTLRPVRNTMGLIWSPAVVVLTRNSPPWATPAAVYTCAYTPQEVASSWP